MRDALLVAPRVLSFVDPVAATAALLALGGALWFRRILRRIPEGPRFLLSSRAPQVGSSRRVVPFFAALWAVGVALWLGGRATESSEAHFFGMILLVTGQITWLMGLLLGRQLSSAAATLRVSIEHDPPYVELQVDGGTRRVTLAPRAVRAWIVGNGLSGPMYLQLALGDGPDTGLELFVSPAPRHWPLAGGASWLNGFTGLSPIGGGPELLDLLAPFIVPANAARKPAA